MVSIRCDLLCFLFFVITHRVFVFHHPPFDFKLQRTVKWFSVDRLEPIINELNNTNGELNKNDIFKHILKRAKKENTRANRAKLQSSWAWVSNCRNECYTDGMFVFVPIFKKLKMVGQIRFM